jgi:hypothetical protein
VVPPAKILVVRANPDADRTIAVLVSPAVETFRTCMMIRYEIILVLKWRLSPGNREEKFS